MSPPDDPNGRKLDDLGRRLDAFERRAEQTGSIPRKQKEPSARSEAMGKAMRLATELVAAVVVGGVIGWALDRWLGTNPALFLVFLVLGIAAGFWNVFKTAWEIQAASEAEQKGAPRVRDDED